jgi:hypothetical protein
MNVTQTAISVTSVELLATLGQSRIVMAADSNGTPAPVVMIDWIGAISMAPAAAKAFSESLVKAINVFEKEFGAIPQDPRAKLTVSGGEVTQQRE